MLIHTTYLDMKGGTMTFILGPATLPGACEVKLVRNSSIPESLYTCFFFIFLSFCRLLLVGQGDSVLMMCVWHFMCRKFSLMADPHCQEKINELRNSPFANITHRCVLCCAVPAVIASLELFCYDEHREHVTLHHFLLIIIIIFFIFFWLFCCLIPRSFAS